jgi:GMP synthase (glutamine-hydrolysing)
VIAVHRHQTVLILDFGSQYTQLIARRIREQAVYSEIHPFNLPIERIRALQPAAIVLSGGPSSCYEPGAPTVSPELFELGVPILGICYGAQLVARLLGGTVEKADKHEYGRAHVTVRDPDGLFRGMPAGEELAVWMSHGDRVVALPPGFHNIGESANSPAAAFAAPTRGGGPISCL